MHPLLGRVLVVLKEDIGVGDDLGDRFRVLSTVIDLEKAVIASWAVSMSSA
jgi:hypothetical protein